VSLYFYLESPASSGVNYLRSSKLESPISSEVQRFSSSTWRVQNVLVWSGFVVLNWNIPLVLISDRLPISKQEHNLVPNFIVFLVLTGESN